MCERCIAAGKPVEAGPTTITLDGPECGHQVLCFEGAIVLTGILKASMDGCKIEGSTFIMGNVTAVHGALGLAIAQLGRMSGGNVMESLSEITVVAMREASQQSAHDIEVVKHVVDGVDVTGNAALAGAMARAGHGKAVEA